MPTPIIYDTNEVGKRLDTLEREKARALSLATNGQFTLPANVMVLIGSPSQPRLVGAATMLYVMRDSSTMLQLRKCTDSHQINKDVVAFCEFLKEHFPSAHIVELYEIKLVAEDYYKLKQEIRQLATQASPHDG